MAKVESRLDEHAKILENQKEKNETLIEMKTLLKMQMEVNKEQNKQMKEITTTLNNVNENLTHLNINQEQLKKDMNSFGNRVDNLESTLNERKIDLGKLIKHIIWTVVPTLVGAYLLFKFGFK